MPKTGLSSFAYEEIKSMILENKLKPGQFISEAQLQDMLGLGRTPVREALLRLSAGELITIHPRKGIEISKISPKSIRDIFEIRSLFEPIILQASYQKLNREQLLQFRQRFQQYQDMENLNLHQSLELAALDNEFHLAIVSPLGNRYVNQLMNTFVDKLTMIRSTVSAHMEKRFSTSNLEHIAIIDALLSGDIDTACTKLKQHIDMSYQEAIKTLMDID